MPDWHRLEDYRRGYSARSELGGGVILDAIHEIDYLRWLFGPVADVVCLAGKLSHLEIDTEDTAAMLLQFANGTFGEVHLDYVQRAYRRTCQIIGDEGAIHWDFAAGQVRWYSARTRLWNQYENTAGWEVNQMYIDEMKHFLAFSPVKPILSSRFRKQRKCCASRWPLNNRQSSASGFDWRVLVEAHDNILAIVQARVGSTRLPARCWPISPASRFCPSHFPCRGGTEN